MAQRAKIIAHGKREQCAFVCKVCGKDWQSVKQHIEAIHNEDITIPSNICLWLGKETKMALL